MTPISATRTTAAVTLGCALGVAFSMGPFFMNAFPIFLPHMAKATGWGRGAISVAFSMAALGAFFVGPVVGILLDRFGGRRIVLAGVLLAGVAVCSFAAIPASYTGYLAIAIFAAAVVSFSSPVPFVFILNQWHDRRLGLALGSCMAMLNIASIGTAALAHTMIEHYGWRTGWLVLGLVMMVGGLLNAVILLHDRPRDSAKAASPIEDGPAGPLSVILRRPSFWVQAIAFPCLLLATAGITVHASAIMLDRGYSPELATGAVVLVFGASVTGRLVTGWVLDRGVPYYWLGALTFPLVAVATLILFFGVGGFGPAIAFIVIGLVNGAETDIIPYALRKSYGSAAFGRIFGICFALCQLGPILGPLLMGGIFDLQGSYGTALLILAGAAVLSGALLPAARWMSLRENAQRGRGIAADALG